jgi:hypothetical protein
MSPVRGEGHNAPRNACKRYASVNSVNIKYTRFGRWYIDKTIVQRPDKEEI